MSAIDIESYVMIWTGLLFGMAFGVVISGMVRPTPLLTAALAGMFILMAFGVRPFIDMAVVPS